MAADYVLARSICDAVAWDANSVRRALAGAMVREVDERCAYLGIDGTARPEVLALALHLCTVISQQDAGTVRFVASRPSLVRSDRGLWGIGQEWLEMIRTAKGSIVIVAPSIDAAAVMNLHDALAAAYSDNVRLTVLYGALGKIERIRSAISIIRESCPRSELLEWPSTKGFLHAKAICVDNGIVYIGSANLTEFGWEKNVEIGMTLSGPVADPIIRYCQGLVEIARGNLEEQSRLQLVR